MKTLFLIKKATVICFGYIFSLIFLSSCEKVIPVYTDQPIKPSSIVAPAGFDWKTSRVITLNISGLKGVSPNITNTLIINSVNGITYNKTRLTMNTDYSLKFSIPVSEENLVINYGSKIKTVKITSDKLAFDYLTE